MRTGNYKWELRKGGGKLICPHCGQMRFVPYVSALDHMTIAGDEFGRCDREQNCGYHKYPNGKEQPNVAKVETPERKPIRFYPAAVQVSPNSKLFDWVCGMFSARHAMAIWQRYRIGAEAGRTVFWQIAKDGTVRAGKSIPYKSDGHRDKADKYPASWLHKAPAWRQSFEGEELQQCYFGEHLLNDMPEAPVVIVESEKTAAVMSELSRSWVWLASGGSQNVKNEERNKALAGREVWMLPDNGQYWNWKQVADANGWQIFDTIEKAPIFEGCDILDYVTGGVWLDLLKHAKK